MKPTRAILILMALLLLLITAVSCVQKEEDAKTNGLWVSRSNLGEEGWMYSYNSDGIFKISQDWNKTKISDRMIFTYQVYNNRLYYVAFKEGTSTYCSIYCADMNGEDEKFLFETIFPMSSVAGRIQFVDDWIFFGVENEDNEYSYDLYRVKLDGTEMSLVSDADDPLFTYEIEEE